MTKSYIFFSQCNTTFQDLNIDNVEIEMPELFSHPSLETHEGSEEEAMVRLRSCSDVSFTPVRPDINIILINLSSKTFVFNDCKMIADYNRVLVNRCSRQKGVWSWRGPRRLTVRLSIEKRYI